MNAFEGLTRIENLKERNFALQRVIKRLEEDDIMHEEKVKLKEIAIQLKREIDLLEDKLRSVVL